MGAATFLSRIAGLLREQTFAYVFGAGKWTDSFNVAFRIPNMLRDLFAEGALSSAFVPTFNLALEKEGKEKAFRLANLTYNSVFIIAGLLVLLGMIFTPEIVAFLAPKFTQDPEQFKVTVIMTRIMSPFLLLVSWAAISMGLLNSMGVFFMPSVAPAFFNFSMIAAGWLICPYMERLFGMPPIVGMAIGAMIGGALQFGVQVPLLYKKGFKFRFILDFLDPGIKRIVKIMIPGIIGLAATQINVAISTMLGTSQGSGAVSYLSYAFRLVQLPIGLFGVAVAQASLPVMSKLAARDARDEMGNTLADSMRLSYFINIFSCVLMVVLAEPIIRIIYQRGNFTATDAQATASVLRLYSLGLVFFSLVKLMGPVFYTFGETAVPAISSVLSVVSCIVLNLLLIKPMGYRGLAFSNSIASLINAAILFVMLTKKFDILKKDSFYFGFLKLSLVTVIAGAFSGIAYNFCASKLTFLFAEASLMNAIASISLAVLASTLLLYALSLAANIKEVKSAADMFLVKFKRKLAKK